MSKYLLSIMLLTRQTFNAWKLLTWLGALIMLVGSIGEARGQAYPFPKNVQYTYGLMPNNKNHADVQAAYDYWKTNFVTSTNACGKRRVIFDYYPGTTRGATDRSKSVSEGIAYGMLIAAYMGDQALFDDFWAYYKMFRNGNGVMHWMIQNCSVNQANGASDAELDVAMALIVASYQWQSDAYLNDAKMMIRVVREKEFDGVILKPGDMFGGRDLVNPSYFSPAYYRVFKKFDPGYETFWDNAAAKGYEIINLCTGTSGLTPDWCHSNGGYSSLQANYEDQGKHFIYDGVRTPFRTAIDYLWHGNVSAKAYCDKFTRWAMQKHNNSPAQIGAKYGTKLSGNDGDRLNHFHNNTFVSCFAIAGMGADGVAGAQTWLDACYTDNKNTNPAYGEYFNASFKLLGMMVMTGNFYLPPPDACTSPELGDDKSLCSSPSVVLNAGVTGRTYTWRRNGTTISGATSQTYTATQPGIYEVIAKDAAGCTRRDKVEIFAATIVPDFVAKKGPGNVTLTNTSTGGISSYSWKIQGGTWATATEVGTTRDLFLDQLAAGSYQISLTVSNVGFGCTSTQTVTKTVVIGDGVGVAMDDFNYLYEQGIAVWDLATSSYFQPLPKIECSREVYDAGGPKECMNLPCSYLRVTGDGKAAAGATYTPFGISFLAPLAPMNLTDVPYVSIKIKSSTALELGVKLQMGDIACDPIFITLAAGVEAVHNLDFSTITTGWNNGTSAAATITAYNAVDAIQFVPFQKDNTWKGTIDIDWIVIGGKSIPPPTFDVKKDALGFTMYGADGKPLSTWSKTAEACTGTASVTAQSCTADQVRWFSGTTQIASGATASLAPGQYFVHLINDGGTTIDTVTVVGAKLEAAFSYNIENQGKGLRLFNQSSGYDSWRWNYGVTPTDAAAPTWEEGYNYYTTDGIYKVCLRVASSVCNKADSICKDIEIKCHAPLGAIGAFTSTPTAAVNDTISVCTGASVTIAVDSVSNASTYGWYGIGTTPYGTAKSITKSFTQSHWIKLEAYNICGEKVVDSIYINVMPVVKAEFVATKISGENYSFQATWVGNSPAVTYSWTVDGTAIGTGIYKEHTFTSPGVHAVKLSVSGACGAKDTTISVGCALPVVSAASITGKSSVCQGERCTAYEITGATGATSYTWTLPGTSTTCTGAGTAAITATIAASGDVSVTANNACGSSSAVVKAVTVATPPVTAAITGNATPNCSAQGVTYSVTPTTGSSYAWTVPTGATVATGAGTASITVNFGTASGTISVIETSAAGCVGAPKSFDVTLAGCNMNADFTTSAPTVCEGATVTYTNTSTGASSSATYSWNFGEGASPATATTAGPHTVTYSTAGPKTVALTVSDAITDTETKTGVVTVNPKPAAAGTITGSASVCSGTMSAYSVPTIANATSYTWTAPTGATFNSTTSAVDITFGTASGNVTVVGNNTCGSGAPSSIAVTVNPGATTSDITGTATPSCSQTGVSYSVTSTTGSTYAWTVPTGATIATGEGTAAITVNFGTANGSVSVTETTSGGCIGQAKTLAITLSGCNMAANFESLTTSVCQGGQVTFTNLSTGTTASTTYSWNFGEGATPATATTAGPHTVTYSTAGSKTVSLSIQEGAGAPLVETKTGYITVSPTVDAGSVGASQTICYNTTPAAFTSTAAASGGTGTYNYQWQQSTDNSTWTNISGATSATYTETAMLTATRSYRRQVTSGGCAAKETAPVLVTVRPQFVAGAIGSAQTICYNTTPSAFTSTSLPTGGTGTYTYQWQSSPSATGSWTNIAGATSATYTVGAPLTATTHYRRVETSGTCGSVNSNSLIITVNPQIVAGAISASQTICSDETPAPFTNTSSPTGGTGTFTYKWQSSPDGTTWTDITSATSATYAVPTAPSTTTSYRRVETSGTCGSVNSNVVTISVSPASAAGEITGDATACVGAVKTYSIAPVTGATSYTWTIPTGSTASGPLQGADLTSISITFGSTSGEVTVTPVNSCGNGTASIKGVTITPAPTTSAITGNANPACNATGVAYSVTATTGSTYQWTLPAGATIASGRGTNAITVDFGSSGGSVSVIETNSAGCAGTEKTLAVSLSGCGLNAEFTAAPLTACIGSQVTFTNASSASATATYSWNFGTGATPATATTAGPHNVTYSSAGLKTVTLTVTDGAASDTETKTNYVTISALPAAAGTITGGTTVCANSVETYSIAPVAGADSYNWTVPTGATVTGTGNSVSVTFGTTSGFVMVTPVNSCGEGSPREVEVTVGSSVSPTASVSASATTISEGDQITFTATSTGGGAAPQYTWYVNSAVVSSGLTSYSTSTLADKDTVYVVLQSSSSCASPTTATSNKVVVTVNTPVPGYSYAGPDQETCEQTVTLAGNTPNCGTGTWTVIEGSGNIQSVNDPASIVTALGVGANKLVWTVSGDCGIATDTVLINVIRPEVFISVDEDTVCRGTQITFTAQAVNGGNTPAFQWKLNGSNVGTNSPTFASSTLNNRDAIRVELTSSLCTVTANSNTIRVAIHEQPSVAFAGNDTSVTTSSVNLKATYPLVGTGTWTTVSGTGTAISINNERSVCDGLSMGENILRWTVTNGVCQSSSDEVIITRGAKPAIQTIVGEEIVLTGSSETYSVNATTGSTFNWTVTGGGATIVSGQGTNEVVIRFTTTGSKTVTLVETNSFGNTTNSKVVSVGDAPQQQTVTGPTQPTANSTATYTVPYNPGSDYFWTVPTGATIIDGQGTNEITVSFGPNVTGDITVTEDNGYGTTTSSTSVQTTTTNVGVGITAPTAAASFDVYPNPFNFETTLRVSTQFDAPVEIRIVDSKGIPVGTFNGVFNNQELKIGEGLRSGVYTVQLKYGERVEFIKLIKVE